MTQARQFGDIYQNDCYLKLLKGWRSNNQLHFNTDLVTKLWFCQHLSRTVVKSQGMGISSGYYERGPLLLSQENRRKIEPKEIPRCLIPLLLVVFTWQLEILVKSLIQSVVKSFALYQYFKWSICTFNLARTTECIFTINNKNNLVHYSQCFIFRYQSLKKFS